MLSLNMLMGCKQLKFCLSLLVLWTLLRSGSQIGIPFAVASSPPESAADILQGVERKYNRFRTLRMRFQQFYRQGNQTLREEEGMLYLSKPGQMRWEYENPEPKLFLTDGKRLILYVPSENRMTETAVKNSADLRTPLRLLLGQLRLQEEFDRIIEGPRDVPPLRKGNIVLQAVPKHLADRLEWVVFEVNPQYEIRRIIISEPGGLQTEFRFEKEEANVPLSSSLFRFQPPPGTEIVQQ
ncbi:MAG: outer membrane lipoprotein carrier protein LolA [Acidobacteria bacterium]|nr:outer membrane lipoprotein carrier protein LolA [Acidobacteriota bacterium]